MPFSSKVQVLPGAWIGNRLSSLTSASSANSSVKNCVSDRRYSAVTCARPSLLSHWATPENASRSRSSSVVRTPAPLGTTTVPGGGKLDSSKLGSPKKPPEPTPRPLMHGPSNVSARKPGPVIGEYSDRKSVVSGKSLSGREDLGGRQN